MKNKIKLLMTCILAIIMITGCTTGSFVTIGSIENNSSSKISMSYQKFDGYKSTKIHVNDGDQMEVSVDIVTEKGKLDLKITDENDKTAYEGNDIPTSNFKVTLDKAGDYTITLNADNHKGSYKISWDKAEK